MVKEKVLISYSGGKDSNAMLLLAIEMGIDFVAVYQDTGFEYSLHYEYLDYVENKLGIKIERVKSKKYDGMLDLVKQKKAVPNRLQRFCTENLKIEPVKTYIKSRSDIAEQWIGVRTGESAARAKRYAGLTFDGTFPLSDFPQFSKRDFGHIDCRLPVVDWTESEVWKIHLKHGLKRNPLYDLGAKRVGCYPCVLSSDKGWRNTWETEEGKANIRRLSELEQWVNEQKDFEVGKPATFRSDYRTVAQLIEQFEQMDRQGDMFGDLPDEHEVRCSWCHG